MADHQTSTLFDCPTCEDSRQTMKSLTDEVRFLRRYVTIPSCVRCNNGNRSVGGTRQYGYLLPICDSCWRAGDVLELAQGGTLKIDAEQLTVSTAAGTTTITFSRPRYWNTTWRTGSGWLGRHYPWDADRDTVVADKAAEGWTLERWEEGGYWPWDGDSWNATGLVTLNGPSRGKSTGSEAVRAVLARMGQRSG